MPRLLPILAVALAANASAAAGRLAAQDSAGAAAPAAATAEVRGPGYVFTLTPRREGVYGVREEVASAELARSLGGRSATAELQVDCRGHQSTLSSVLVFPEAGAAGAPASVSPGAWMKAAPVDLYDLSAPICTPTSAAAQPAVAPPLPEPTTAVESPSAAADASPTRTAPELPPPPEPLRESAEATAPAAARASPTTAAAGRWVQLGAFASPALAEAAWARLEAAGARLRAPSHRLEAVQRGDARLLRLLAGPFPTLAAAQAACSAARGAGAACLVR